MKVKETYLNSCFVIEPKLFFDTRGYFYESFNKLNFEELLGINVKFVQDNEAFSNKGVLRGLHFQTGKYAQAKLVRVIKGKVLDVVVDLRKNSKTFAKTFSCILSEENKKQLFIPKGFAHGYLVLEDNTIFSYKCDCYYNKDFESGIRYNDKQLNINWILKEEEIIISNKDKKLLNFDEYIKIEDAKLKQ
ncbi:dTDP-4-dehydrorhamnose 3,5-epimerase [Lutibacter sp. Hel_I_33_5]|uniref:dTDP-4-dehydrorhamnose 3,5-epimerase n=1 Tax=Lutibacter sp. Hel_I_33_5 TaxID=1566289 RepID=UPI00119F6E0E|nr:dTDP-4-dehydrorhamnose 3,5-epimerase [Lutibacter sp. Hel_I_33_5]TVZ56200.1 dTDP-4-dehydrorhamnose 3,5-epimerase [Lutibacter sp. Hel_I_33_5]